MSDTRARQAAVGVALALIALHVAIAQLSAAFPDGADPRTAPTWRYITLAALAGLAVPALIALIPAIAPTRRVVLAALGVGVALRLILFASTPVLEDDWRRYLWDGASVSAGVDPYAYAPIEAAAYDAFGAAIPGSDDPQLRRLQDLARAHPETHAQVTYPYIKTIYPPIAQAAFAAAHMVAPFSLTAWRGVLLIADLVSVVVLIGALRAYGRSPLWALLYWWNPVVTLEVFNAGHMDALLVPFLAAAAWAARARRTALAAAAIACAAAVKLWPILLAFAAARPRLQDPAALARAGVIGAALTAVLLWPQLIRLADPDAGLAAYAETWRRHAFVFAALSDGVFAPLADPDRAARLTALALTLGVAVWAARRSPADGSGAAPAMLAAVAALVFLSPTGYPWYGVWLFALLPFAPRIGLAALAVTVPLYYVRFVLGDADPWYQWAVTPAAFGLPLLILLAETIHARRARR